MKIAFGSYVKQRIIKNLLNAHVQLADSGNVTDLIKLSKFILRSSKQCENEILDFRMEDSDDCAKCPPNECEGNGLQLESNEIHVRTYINQDIPG